MKLENDLNLKKELPELSKNYVKYNTSKSKLLLIVLTNVVIFNSSLF